MKKTIEKKNHGKKIIMHLKRHHKKYLFGAIGGFALTKLALLLFGLSPVLNIGNIFADSEGLITLDAEYLNTHCPQDDDGNISCTGKNIGSIEPGIFSGMTINTLDLSYNKLSSLDFEVFTGSTIVTLDISHNQIYEISNPETINDNNATVDIYHNCLSNDMVTKVNHTNGNQDQFACFYVIYSSTGWTKGPVHATLSVIGKDSIVNEVLSNVALPNNTFNNSGFQQINFGNLFEDYSGNILNYPENSQKFPATVNWIDTMSPTCSENWTYDGLNITNNGWNNHEITATLSDSTDDESGILTSEGICYIEEGIEAKCTVEISDIAGNTNQCESRTFNIDETAPVIILSAESGDTASNDSVEITITDNIAGLNENQSLYYRWQTGVECSSVQSQYNSIALGNNEGSTEETVEIPTVGKDGEYYLCILSGIKDRAGNTNQGIQSQGLFKIGNGGYDSTEEALDLIQFTNQPNSSWVHSIDITINLADGALGGFVLTSDTGSISNLPLDDYSSITSSPFVYSARTDDNHKYICAYASSGTYIQHICSNYPILVDPFDPYIDLLSPVDGSGFDLGTNITLSWSGSDSTSGISGYTLKITDPDGTTSSYILSSSTNSQSVSLNKSGTWNWTVYAHDFAGNNTFDSGYFFVRENTITPDPGDNPGDLIRFTNQSNGSWVHSIDITINLANGAVGGYILTDNTGNDFYPSDYSPINSSPFVYSARTDDNHKYICAYASSGTYIQHICSNYPILVDPIDPYIDLLSPANGSSFDLGTNITLSWSGSDSTSGISGYTLKITDPDGTTSSYILSSSTNSQSVSLNKSGTWNWTVYAHDFAGNNTFDSGYFFVRENTITPDPGDNPGDLIRFTNQPNGSWVHSIDITINLADGALGGYIIADNTGNTFNLSDYSPINSSYAYSARTADNHKYICAYASYGTRIQRICSNYPILVDPFDPYIDLLSPVDGSSFNLGTNITLSWSGSDSTSGISGYALFLTNSGDINYFSLSPSTNSQSISLNKSGTRTWNVYAYDFAGNNTFDSGYFFVRENTITPDPGDNPGSDTGNYDIVETGFYLISPKLFEQFEVGRNITFTWNTGNSNSGYIWYVGKIGGNTILSGNTQSNDVIIDGGYFTIGNYFRSVTEISTDITKTIPLFYVFRTGSSPDLKVDQFEFNEIENAEPNEYYKSNRITIDGLEDGWYTFAYLKNGIGALYINGNYVGTGGIVTNGDNVRIELKASNGYDDIVSTKLIVGTGNYLVSGDFKITTKDGINGWDDGSLTSIQKLWGIIYIDSLVEMYMYDEEKLAAFLSTFMQLLQDKSDYYAQKILEAQADGNEDLEAEYRTYKNAIDFLYTIVKYRYDNLELKDRTVYIAPNGKQYLVEYNEDRMAYTSPDFARPKYFPTWEAFTNHIDINNPAVGKRGIVGNVITTHNGKVYTIYETNGKWTSSNFRTAKYFDTKEDIINHILANNPASDWNHTIDTDFDEVKYTAPNGKVYKIFKTSSKGNNPNMYSSYNFVNAKYFTSLEAAKKFIDQNNRK